MVRIVEHLTVEQFEKISKKVRTQPAKFKNDLGETFRTITLEVSPNLTLVFANYQYEPVK